MNNSPSKVLILGHSFVRRLKCDLNNQFDNRVSLDCGLQGTATIYMHGIGGRTVSKLRRHDLNVVGRLSPQVVILEIGTNDLARGRPEVVGSEIEELVQLLLESFSVKVVGVCHVTPRDDRHALNKTFNTQALVLKSQPVCACCFRTLLMSCFLLDPPRVFKAVSECISSWRCTF